MSLRRGLFVQLQVVHALILRETRTRFGKHQLGYLWALLEPMMWIGTFLAAFSLAERSAPPGMTMVGFLITGLVPYQLFRECSSRVSLAVDSNKGLLFYPQVQPLDLMISRGALEGATALSVFSLLLGLEAVVLGYVRPDNLIWVVSGFVLILVLAAALGMIFGSLAILFPSTEKVSGVILRPLFWLSGVFYTANDVPAAMADVIVYNPILHCVELVRDGWYSEYTSRHLDVVYPMAWCVGLLFMGLAMERTLRHRIQLT